MTINSEKKVIRFSHRKKPTTPEEVREIEKRVENPYMLAGKDKLRAFHQWRGLEFDEEIFERIIAEYSLE